MWICENEEFDFSVVPSTEPLISSPEFIIIGIHADITLVSFSDDYYEDIEYESDLDYLTHECFLYDKDLKLGREEFLRNEKVSRTALVNALTSMKVRERYHNEIIDEVLCFGKDETFSRCHAVSVHIEIVRYADDEGNQDDDDADDDEIKPPRPTRS